MDSTAHSRPLHTQPTVIAAMAAVLALYLLPLAGQLPTTNPNELVRLELAVAVAELGTVDLEAASRVYGLSEDVARHRGRILADKAPGLSLAAVPVVWIAGGLLPSAPGSAFPAYWPLRHVATGLLVSLVVVLAASLLSVEIGRVTGADPVPLLVLAALCTPLWSYGTVFFGHAAAAALVAVAWILLIGPGGDDPRPRHDGAAVVGGLAAGLAVATEYPTAILVCVVLASVAARRTAPRRILLTVCGVAAGLLPAAMYHQIAFGAPWLTGYAFKADAGFASIHATGVAGVSWPTMTALWGVLAGSARGLFFFCPLLLLAPVGLVVLHRRGGWRDAAPPLIATLAYVVFAAGFVDWTAGWSAAARHLVPVIPVLLIPTFAAVGSLACRFWSSMAVAALAAISVLRSVLTVALTPFFPPQFNRPLSQLVAPSFAEGFAAPNLISAVSGSPPWMVWVGAAAAAAIAVAWSSSRLSSGHGRWTIAATAVALAVQIGWIAVQSSRVDPQLELYRKQVLVKLGHRVAGPASDVPSPGPTLPTSVP